jgi:hypothetical protein
VVGTPASYTTRHDAHSVRLPSTGCPLCSTVQRRHIHAGRPVAWHRVPCNVVSTSSLYVLTLCLLVVAPLVPSKMVTRPIFTDSLVLCCSRRSCGRPFKTSRMPALMLSCWPRCRVALACTTAASTRATGRWWRCCSGASTCR